MCIFLGLNLYIELFLKAGFNGERRERIHIQRREKGPEMKAAALKSKLALFKSFTQGWLCLEKAFFVNRLLKGQLFV